MPTRELESDDTEHLVAEADFAAAADADDVFEVIKQTAFHIELLNMSK